MIVWIYIVGAGSLALLGWLLWKEWRRPNRSYLAGRVVAAVLATAALAGLALPLNYHRKKIAPGAGGAAVFLTEGYDPDSVRQFVAAYPGLREIWDDTVVGPVRQTEGLHVFGYGLTGEQWASLRQPVVSFHPGVLTAGLVAIDWERRLWPGQRLTVQGHWQGRAVKLELTGLGAVLDSAMTGNGDFLLSVVPAQTGRAVYRLIALVGSDTLEQEEIPIEVRPGRSLKVLILAATPDFENTFLVNWLANAGHQVASRTAVSRDNYQSSFVNMAPCSLDKLTSSLLTRFDVVIADAAAIPVAGSAELQVLRRQVEEGGLGLIIKADSAGPAGVGIGGGGQVRIARARDSLQPPYLTEKPGMRLLVRDSFSRMAVGGTLYGAGKVVWTLLNTTYVRMLGGKRADYAGYWSDLLRRVAREAEPGEEWQLKPVLSRVREQMEVTVQTNRDLPQGIVRAAEPIDLYLAQEADLPTVWRAKYWPEQAGWQTLSTLGMGAENVVDTTWFYIWPREAWVVLRREQRRQETLAYMGERERGDEAASGDQELKDQEVRDQVLEIPKFWFYIIFLINVFFLWVERKIGGMSGEMV
jgi:hypothetical protein